MRNHPKMTFARILGAVLPPRSAIWLVVGLLVGATGGAYLALRWIAPQQTWLASVGQSFMLTQMSFGQYEEAEYPAAKAALEGFLAYLESSEPRQDPWQPGQEPWLDERGLAFDKALTVGRLALLEEREHNGTAAAEYWAIAEDYARIAAWRDPSRENIRKFLQRLDGDGQPSERRVEECDEEDGDA